MEDLFCLSMAQIKNSILTERRQYLTGNLKKPQLLPFYRTDTLEVGVTLYTDRLCDEPHYHTTTEDAIYIIKGRLMILKIKSEEEIVIEEGGFVVIPKNTPYISKAEYGTEVLFMKAPKDYDKIKVDVSDKIKEWMDE